MFTFSTLLLLAVSGAMALSDGIPLILVNCSAKDTRQIFIPNNTDTTIRIAIDGKCIDISNYGTTTGSQFQNWDCHTDDKLPSHQNQEFKFQGNTIVSTLSNMCMSASASFGALVVLGPCADPNAQWKVVPTATQNQALLQHVASGMCASVGTASSGNPCLLPQYKSLPFCDYTLSIDARVKDIVSRLQTGEKIQLLGNNAGVAPSIGWSMYQWWSEALHGVANSPGVSYSNLIPFSTSFPQVCTTGASFDPELFREIGVAIGTEARAMANQQQAGLTFWAPNLNIFRDPRWGRGQETPGEDPFLTTTYVRNFVHSIQYHRNDTKHLLASSCCKHYAAYSLENYKGMDRYTFNAVVNAQDLADTYTPAFEACVHQDGGAASGMMCSYNAVNGVPSCANTYLLTTLARQSWGFDGYITSDCGAVDCVLNNHHYTNTTDQTCSVTLKAGMDLDCGSFLQSHTNQAINDGAVQQADVDGALSHLFRVQMRLGMFDPIEAQPFLKIPPTAVNSPAHQKLALVAAQEGIVLLENRNGLLPLNASSLKTIAVIGPNADNGPTMQGNYYGQAPYLITPRMGIAQRVPNAQVRYAKGSNISDKDTSGFPAACTAATGADVVVIVIGIDQTVEQEGQDRVAISIPGVQKPLVDEVIQCSKGAPVIVVMMNGGSLDVTAIRDNGGVNALLWVGYPGQSGGQALANILFGDVPPSGRMPYTTYQADYVNQISMFDMNMRPNPQTGSPGRTYRFFTGTPVYPFGYGLSYTTWSYKAVSPREVHVSLSDVNVNLGGTHRHTGIGLKPLMTVELEITNTGSVTSDHSVLVYAVAPGAGQNGVPLKSLVGFDRVRGVKGLGGKGTVKIELTAASFAVAGVDGELRGAPGVWRLVSENEEVFLVRVE